MSNVLFEYINENNVSGFFLFGSDLLPEFFPMVDFEPPVNYAHRAPSQDPAIVLCDVINQWLSGRPV